MVWAGSASLPLLPALLPPLLNTLGAAGAAGRGDGAESFRAGAEWVWAERSETQTRKGPQRRVEERMTFLGGVDGDSGVEFVELGAQAQDLMLELDEDFGFRGVGQGPCGGGAF